MQIIIRNKFRPTSVLSIGLPSGSYTHSSEARGWESGETSANKRTISKNRETCRVPRAESASSGQQTDSRSPVITTDKIATRRSSTARGWKRERGGARDALRHTRRWLLSSVEIDWPRIDDYEPVLLLPGLVARTRFTRTWWLS